MNVAVLITDQAFAPKSGPPLALRAGAFQAKAQVWQDAAIRAGAARLLPRAEPGRMASGLEVEDFASLIEAIAVRQDRAAFTRVFAYYGPRVKAYLLRLGLQSSEAEEVAQEVMVAVWRKASSFDRAQASAATWIFRIARNRRIDLFRRDQRGQLDANDPAFEPVAETPPDRAAEAAEREAQVRRAMGELPPDQRELVRRAFYEDQSHSEIAAETGVPLGTVKSRLRLAFAKLKLKLADVGEGVDLTEALA
jgi:RNA polymerase sigma-70 factor (ECF subfamily)